MTLSRNVYGLSYIALLFGVFYFRQKKMKLAVVLCVLLAGHLAMIQAQLNNKFDLKLPKFTPKPFDWSGSVLHNNGRPNGVSLTGTWKPRGSGNSFTGSGSWQDKKGFGGSFSGAVGVGRGTSVLFGVNGGGGRKLGGHVGVRLRFRRSALARALLDN